MFVLLVQFADDLSIFNVFRYITFRTGGALITSALIVFMFGPSIIDSLRIRQGRGQPIRADGPQTHFKKAGTPTMGGLMIMSGILGSALLWANLSSLYVWAVLFVAVGFGAIGFYDDYYIVSFRGAACAYIPKDAAHYDTKFIGLYRQAAAHSGSVEYGTKLRTGPDDSYPEIKTMNAGVSVECLDEIDGWYMIRYSGKGADGEVFAFIDSDAVSVNW